MRKLLNTLYVTTPEAYLSKEWAECSLLSVLAGGGVSYSCHKYRRHRYVRIYGRKSRCDRNCVVTMVYHSHFFLHKADSSAGFKVLRKEMFCYAKSSTNCRTMHLGRCMWFG